MNLLLIGYRGCGKTTVAKLLAERLSWQWFDADAEIERLAGVTIREIFSASGEAGFRELEAAVVADLCRRVSAVIALGGGAVLRESNRQAMQAGGHVVWLRAKAEILQARIESDPLTAQRRPNLTSLGGAAEIHQLLAARTPLYESCANLTLNADAASPAELATAIEQWFRGEIRS